MKRIIKLATNSVMAFALVFSLCAFSVSAKEVTEEATVTSPAVTQPLEEVMANLPSKPLVGTGNATITDWGMVYVNLYNNPQTVNEIWILGNKNGGGANTSASFLSTITPYGPTASINGGWQRIYNGGINVSGGQIAFSVDVADNSTAYNIAIVCY